MAVFNQWDPKRILCYSRDRRIQNTKYRNNCPCSKQSEIGSLMKGEVFCSKTKQDTKSWPQISWQIAVISDTPLEEKSLKRFILNQHEFRTSSNQWLCLNEVRGQSQWKSVVIKVRSGQIFKSLKIIFLICLIGQRRVITVTCINITLIQTQMMKLKGLKKKQGLLL